MADQRMLLRLYKQLASTMETLIEIQKLEEQETPQQVVSTISADNPPVKDKAKIPRNKQEISLFDEGTEDIKRIDQVKKRNV
jgi:hypothetical protein